MAAVGLAASLLNSQALARLPQQRFPPHMRDACASSRLGHTHQVCIVRHLQARFCGSISAVQSQSEELQSTVSRGLPDCLQLRLRILQ